MDENRISKIIDDYIQGFQRLDDIKKQNAIQKLVEIGESSIHYLIKRLEDSWDGFAGFFEKMGETAFEPLKKAYQLSFNKEFRIRALKALIATGDPRMKDFVIDAIKKDKGLRGAALEGLQNYNSPGMQEVLFSIIRDKDIWAKEKKKVHVILASNDVYHIKYAKILVELLRKKDTSSLEYVDILNGLAKLKVKTVELDLINLLSQTSLRLNEVKNAVVDALHEIFPEKYGEKNMEQILNSLSEDVKDDLSYKLMEDFTRENITLLVKSGDKRVLDKLKEGLVNLSGSVRQASATGLLIYLNKEYTEDEENYEPRFRNDNFGKAFNIVESKLKERILSNLEQIAKYNSNYFIQRKAIQHLAIIKNEKAIRILIDCLAPSRYYKGDLAKGDSSEKDYDERLVDHVIDELSESQYPQLKTLLIEALSSDCIYKSLGAAQAISTIYREYRTKNFTEIVNSLEESQKSEVISSLQNILTGAITKGKKKAARHLLELEGKNAEKYFIQAYYIAEKYSSLHDLLYEILVEINDLTSKEEINKYFKTLKPEESEDVIYTKYESIIAIDDEYDFNNEVRPYLRWVHKTYPSYSEKKFHQLIEYFPKDVVKRIFKSLFSLFNSSYTDVIKLALERLSKFYNPDGTKSFGEVVSNFDSEIKEILLNELTILIKYEPFVIDYLVQIDDESLEERLIKCFIQTASKNQETLAVALAKLNPKYANKNYFEIYRMLPDREQERILEVLDERIKRSGVYHKAESLRKLFAQLKTSDLKDQLEYFISTRSDGNIKETGEKMVKMKDKRAIDLLFKVLEEPEYPHYRGSIISLLGAFKDPRIIEPLKKKIGESADYDDRIIKAISEIDPSFKFKKISDFFLSLEEEEREEYIQRYINSYSDKRHSQLHHTISIFQETKEKKALPLLKSTLTHSDVNTREAAAKAIGIINNMEKTTYSAVINSLSSKERVEIVDKLISNFPECPSTGDKNKVIYALKYLEQFSGINDDRVIPFIELYIDKFGDSEWAAAQLLRLFDDDYKEKNVLQIQRKFGKELKPYFLQFIKKYLQIG